jgi:hypothetical protein
MFLDIPEVVRLKMEELEKRDTADRVDGTSRLDRLRQIPAETGQFIAVLAASVPEGAWIEIGTSAGYSALWLSLACRERGKTLTTYEILASKSAMAAETFAEAQVGDVVSLVEGDFLDHVGQLGGIGGFNRSSQHRCCYAAFDSSAVRASPGVAQSSVLRGRPLRAAATTARSAALCTDRLVLFGKY